MIISSYKNPRREAGSVKFTTCFWFINLCFSGDSNKKSIDLPFWYNVSDQTFTNPKMRQCS